MMVGLKYAYEYAGTIKPKYMTPAISTRNSLRILPTPFNVTLASRAEFPWSARRRAMMNAFSSGFSHFASSGKSDRKKKTARAISTVKAPSMMNS